MNDCASWEVVVAKIQAEGATREAAHDDGFSLWFSKELREKKRFFQIPTPLRNGGYSSYHLEVIEGELFAFDIDLLPLDHNLLN